MKHRGAHADQRGRGEHHQVVGGKRHQQEPDERRRHAEHERIGRRIAVGVVADHRLQQRRRALKGEGDDADLAKIERERAFQHGIDRHDQRLDHVVQHVADADRGEHGDHGAFAAAAARGGRGGALAAPTVGCLSLDCHVVCRRCVGRQNWDNPTRTSRIYFWGNVADGRGMHAPMMFAAWSWLQELH